MSDVDEDNLEELYLSRYDNLPVSSDDDDDDNDEDNGHGEENNSNENQGNNGKRSAVASSRKKGYSSEAEESQTDGEDNHRSQTSSPIAFQLEKAAKRKLRLEPRAKIDADRILGSKGLDFIARNGPLVKLNGRDEMENFAKLMLFYRSWTSNFFPNLKHEAVIERVEKICHSKSMKSVLSEGRKKFRMDNNSLANAFPVKISSTSSSTQPAAATAAAEISSSPPKESVDSRPLFSIASSSTTVEWTPELKAQVEARRQEALLRLRQKQQSQQ